MRSHVPFENDCHQAEAWWLGSNLLSSRLQSFPERSGR
jgi:hypothetical protein